MPRYHRLVFDGSLANDRERWSCGIAYGANAIVPSPIDLSEWADAVMDSLRPSTGPALTLKQLWSSSGALQRVRAYSYPDPGEPADIVGESVGEEIEGTGGTTFPPQCSLVVTLNTGVPGRSQRGRFYWPMQGGALLTGGLSALVSSTTASAFSGLIANWGTLLVSGPFPPVVASEKTGNLTVVSSVSLDNVIDTQRRRRDKLVGTRFNSPV